MTMSRGSGAMSATMSLPDTPARGAGARSVVRLFFQDQEPASHESDRRVPGEEMTGSSLALAAASRRAIAFTASQASSPQEVSQRLIDSRIGSGLSPQKL